MEFAFAIVPALAFATLIGSQLNGVSIHRRGVLAGMTVAFVVSTAIFAACDQFLSHSSPLTSWFTAEDQHKEGQSKAATGTGICSFGTCIY